MPLSNKKVAAMKLSSLAILVLVAPMALSACQSTQSSVSTFSGARLAGDVAKKEKRVVARTAERGQGIGTPSTKLTRKRPANEAASKLVKSRENLDQPAVKRPAAKKAKSSKDETVVAGKTKSVAVVSSNREIGERTSLFSLPAKVVAKNNDAPKKTAAKKRASKTVRGGGSYRNLIAKYARANGVPVKLALAVVQVESNFRPNARGRAGEIGLMQLMPRTARGIGYRGSMKALYKPDTNIRYGMKYLGKAYKLGGRSTCGAILKYNAGHGAKRMNPISRKYCKRVARIMRNT